jgi:hypothetical protein
MLQTDKIARAEIVDVTSRMCCCMRHPSCLMLQQRLLVLQADSRAEIVGVTAYAYAE